MLNCPKVGIVVMTLLRPAVAAPREMWMQKQMPMSAFAQDMMVTSAADVAKVLLTKLGANDQEPEDDELYTRIRKNELGDKVTELVKLTSDLEGHASELRGNLDVGNKKLQDLEQQMGDTKQVLTVKLSQSANLNERIKKFVIEVEQISDNYHKLLEQTQVLGDVDLTK